MPDNNSPATKADLQNLEQRLTANFDKGFEKMRECIAERTRDLLAELLRAFSDCSNSAGVRFQKLEAVPATSTRRPRDGWASWSGKMTDFKLRLIALEGQR